MIDNKTISRKHLVVKRSGDAVILEILGRNGIFMNDQVYSEQNIKCKPPISFVIGDVSCTIEAEVDEDKTVIVMPDQQAAIQQHKQHQPPESSYTSNENERYMEQTANYDTYQEETPKPFDPAPSDTFIKPQPAPPQQSPPSSFAPQPPVQNTPGNQSYGYEQPSSGGEPQRPSHKQFEPVTAEKKIKMNKGPNILSSFFSNRNNIIITAIVGLALLIIVVLLVVLFSGDDKQDELLPDIKTEIVEPAETAPVPDTASDYHKILLDQAEALIKSGDPVTAKDLLLDIPKNSPYYKKANALMTKLQGE